MIFKSNDIFSQSFSFSKKNVFELEKSKVKFLDLKRDGLSRLKHLKLITGKFYKISLISIYFHKT